MDLDDFLGASILIALTFVDCDGSERLESYIGNVTDVRMNNDQYESVDDGSNSDVLIVECHDGQARTFPFDPEAINPADPGFYELKDGATIENPDYEMFWRVTAPTKN